MAGKRRARQVRAEARLRFGPQRRQLRAAMRDVNEAFVTDVDVANETARGSKRAARAAKPQITKAIGDAQRTVSQGPTPGVSAALGNLGPAAARDHEGAKRRLAETLAMATTELDQRVVDAEGGRSGAILQAASTRTAEKRRLRDQLRGLAGDAGTFAAARSGELGQEAADRRIRRRGQDVTRQNNRDSTAQAERNSKRSAGIDPDTGKPIKGGKLDPKANKPKATAPQKQDAQSAVSLARAQIQRLRSKENLDRGRLGPLLVEGRDDMTLKVDKAGKPLPQPVKVPGVKKVDQLWASVALDVEFDGKISQANMRRLRKLGYGARALDLLKYKPKSRRAQRRDGNKAVNKSPGSDRAQG
jgi:hypothetical protein